MQRHIEIGIVLFPGVQLAAVYGLIDLFAIANEFAGRRGGEDVASLHITQWRQHPSEQEPMRDAPIVHDRSSSPAVLLLPPCLGDPLSREQAEFFAGWLARQHRNGTTLASVCGGAFLLGETGLLAGRTVTTHWALADAFRQRFPEALLNADRLLIDDGDIISAGGMMAWTDLGLKLVDRFLGPTVMCDTARFLLVDPPNREQRYYSVFSPDLTHGDPAILKVQHWLQATGAKDMSLASLAVRAGLEERTLLRRFRKATGLTPIDYCQRVRVGKGCELLQFGHLAIDAIAWEVGYGDPSAFRKVFQRIIGLTPGEYRRRFSVERG
ncbi:GlxA family transcriptional regulator [Cupriavidus pampae]|uniref:HTH-type transcriptional activator RhaR n=1 Tax=Cupriavidus pampae TaxID=659251 RepID=A0ABN7ZF92_9BURK|nr:GlxA family transcriptional regulator [Cupriavidus pampae]CAG9182759.1 HTH-type transcriptional activator RhaR [Cupriavidus pampae]